MALYRHNATGFLGEFTSDPGAGYTAISAMPTDTVANRVTWWRALDTYGQTSSWHPSITRDPEDPAEAVVLMSFSKDAAFFSADSTGAVTDAYLGGSCTVSVYRGVTDVTDSEGWTLTKVDDGCASTLTKSGGIWTLTITDVPLLATQSGYVRVTATRSGVTRVRDWNWMKVQSGADGVLGADGARGSRQILVTTADGIWSDLTAWDGIVTQTGTTPVLSDLVTIAKSDGSVATSKFCTGNSASPGVWTTPNAYINGSLLVTGSVGANQIAANSITADRIDSRGLSIKDASGNIILAAGTALSGYYVPAGGANWLRAPAAWTFTGGTTFGTNEVAAGDRSYIRFPASRPILEYTDSPSVTLPAGTYTLSIKAYNTGGTGSNRDLSWQIFTGATLIAQDAKTMAASVLRYTLSFALASSTTIYVRVFCGTTSDKEVRAFDLKLETGSAPTPWLPNTADAPGINNPITSANVGTFIANASIDSAKIASLTADLITAGTLNGNNVTVTNLNATNITTGTLNGVRVGSGVSGNVITTGTLNASLCNVTNLNASNITTGNLSATRISGGTFNASLMTVTNLSASSITTGTLNASNITVTNLRADSITVGTLNTEQITNGAVSSIVANSLAPATIYPTSGAWVSPSFSITIPANANRGKVLISVMYSGAGATGLYINIKIRRSDNLGLNLAYATDINYDLPNIAVLNYVDTSAPTSQYYYEVDVFWRYTGSSLVRTIHYSATELKR